MIEPHGGQLNYQSVYKDPLKFYDTVFNQDITKHKVKEDASPCKKTKTVTSKVTKRPFLKMMEKIKLKLLESLKNKIGEEFGAKITMVL